MSIPAGLDTLYNLDGFTSAGQHGTLNITPRYAFQLLKISPRLIWDRNAYIRSPQASFASNETPVASLALNERKISTRAPICVVYLLDESDRMCFSCEFAGCRSTFSRWAEFKRHYNGVHAVEKEVHWCPSLGCDRGQVHGNNPFPRRDKMMDHARKVHGLNFGSQAA